MNLDSGKPLHGAGGHDAEAKRLAPAIKDELSDATSSKLHIHQAHPEGIERQEFSGGTQDIREFPITSRHQAKPDFQALASHEEKRGRVQPGDTPFQHKDGLTNGSNRERQSLPARSVPAMAESKEQLSVRLRSDPQQSAQAPHPQAKQVLGASASYKGQSEARIDLQNDRRAAPLPTDNRKLPNGAETEGARKPVLDRVANPARRDAPQTLAGHATQFGKQPPTAGQPPAKQPPQQPSTLHQQPGFQHEQTLPQQPQPLAIFPARAEDQSIVASNHPRQANQPFERSSSANRTPVARSVAESSTRLAIIQDQVSAEQKHNISTVARLTAIFDACNPFRRDHGSRHTRRMKDTPDKEPTVREGYIMWSGVFDFSRVNPVTYKQKCRRPGGCVLKINDSSFCDKCIKPE